jgi:hypothetical protein
VGVVERLGEGGVLLLEHLERLLELAQHLLHDGRRRLVLVVRTDGRG